MMSVYMTRVRVRVGVRVRVRDSKIYPLSWLFLNLKSNFWVSNPIFWIWSRLFLNLKSNFWVSNPIFWIWSRRFWISNWYICTFKIFFESQVDVFESQVEIDNPCQGQGWGCYSGIPLFLFFFLSLTLFYFQPKIHVSVRVGVAIQVIFWIKVYYFVYFFVLNFLFHIFHIFIFLTFHIFDISYFSHFTFHFSIIFNYFSIFNDFQLKSCLLFQFQFSIKIIFSWDEYEYSFKRVY
jgi:hypothetical protein